GNLVGRRSPVKSTKRFAAFAVLGGAVAIASTARPPGAFEAAASAATAAPTSASNGSPSIAYVMASPNAQCSIHPSGQNAPAGVAVADDQGVVRFYTPPASWGRKLSVDCASGNTTVTYAVDLTAPSAFPTSSNTVSAPKVRPALTGDPTTYSQQWLV